MSEISKSRQWQIRAGLCLSLVAVGVVVIKNRPVSPVVPAAQPAPATQALEPIVIAAPPLAEEVSIRPDLRQALGRVAGIAPQQRLDLLAAVRGTLSPAECQAVLHELLLPRGPDIQEGWFSVYVQNLALLLREQPAVRESFARALATLARDPSRDAVVRDYAVQHLRQVWDRAAETPALRASIEKTFGDLTTGAEPAMAATGLLSLHLLGTQQADGALTDRAARPVFQASSTLPGSAEAPLINSPGGGRASLDPLALSSSKPAYEVPDARVQPLVESVLNAPASAANTASRLTALRVVSDRHLTAEAPALRRIVADDTGEHALTRMAAISALAQLHDPADRALLESLDRRDGRIAGAVKSALATFR